MVAKLLTYLKASIHDIKIELRSFHDLDEENQISIELLMDIHKAIKLILEENAGNINGSKEAKISFASNETVLIGDVSAVSDEEAAPVAPGESK